MQKVAKHKVDKEIKLAVKNLLEEIGGMVNFIKSGERILIKPNYNTADLPPASTATDFLQAVVELCFEAGASEVTVGESSTYTIRNHSISTEKTLCQACVYDLARAKRAPKIVIFDDLPWVTKEVKKGKFLKKVSVPKLLDEVDKVILLPCCKTHFIAQYTGALKIAIGLMKPSERIRLHLGKVSEKVAEMNTIYQPNLIIMDARKCFISGGPSKGKVREPGIILASTSRVAIDIEEVKIIQSFEGNSLAGLLPERITQIKHALELGVE